MSDQEIQRWTGLFGIASGVLFLVLFLIYGAIGASPRAEDAASFTDWVARSSGPIHSQPPASTMRFSLLNSYRLIRRMSRARIG